MSKEEFEAIESVHDYLGEIATEMALNNDMPIEVVDFWVKSYSKYVRYYIKVSKEFYGFDL